jgi:hypothetical protein
MNKNTKLKECWIWNDTITNFIKLKMKGYTLNCPCGLSIIGDVLADIDPKIPIIEKVDMNKLPYACNTFDTVIQDPPWKISYYKRMKPFFECVRVCKLGGKIIYNAYWIPQSKYVTLEELYVRQDGQFTNASVISLFRKTKDLPEKDRKLNGGIK